MAGIGMAAAAVVIAGGIVLYQTSSGPSPVGPALGQTTAAPVSTLPVNAVPEIARRAATGFVTLRVTTADGTVRAGSVAVAPGGYVATTAAAVRGAKAVRATTATGATVAARVVGVDESSNLSVVKVGAAVSVPAFVDDGSMAPGAATLTLSVAPPAGPAPAISTGSPGGGRSSAPTSRWVHPDVVLAAESWSVAGRRTPPAGGGAAAPSWSAGDVSAVATPIGTGSEADLAGIVVIEAGSGGAVPRGSVLVSTDGAVLGLLDRTNGERATYLPATFVADVASELMTEGAVHHGWLDVRAIDATGPGDTGALVTAVTPDGAAATSLRAHDVIVAVDGEPVRTMAELRSRLYVLPPGSPATLTVERDGAPMTVTVRLAPSP
jgi:S1-C subfamily serine protease